MLRREPYSRATAALRSLAEGPGTGALDGDTVAGRDQRLGISETLSPRAGLGSLRQAFSRLHFYFPGKRVGALSTLPSPGLNIHVLNHSTHRSLVTNRWQWNFTTLGVAVTGSAAAPDSRQTDTVRLGGGGDRRSRVCFRCSPVPSGERELNLGSRVRLPRQLTPHRDETPL